MNSLALLAALAAVGIDFGYEPAADGQLEYILQVEPQLVDRLVRGQDLTSNVPRELEIRHFRLTIGSEKLPRQSLPADGRNVRNRPTGEQSAPGQETSAVRVGYQELADRSGEYVIELDPGVLNDLRQHDITGDLPAGVPITRFRISTQEGRAPLTPVPPAHETDRVTAIEDSPNALDAPAARDSNLNGDPSAAGQRPAAVASNEPTDNPRLEPRAATVKADRLDATWPAEDSAANPAAATNEEQAFDPQDAAGDNPNHLVPVPARLPAAAQSGAVDDSRAANPRRPNFDDPPSGPAMRDPLAGDEPLGNGRSPAGNEFPQNNPRIRDRAADATFPSHEAASENGHTGRTNIATGQHPTANDRRTQHAGQPESAVKHPATAKSTSGHAEHSAAQPATEAKPWLPLTISLLGLCVSIGGNVYLAWVAWDARNRCRQLLSRLHAGEMLTEPS